MNINDTDKEQESIDEELNKAEDQIENNKQKNLLKVKIMQLNKWKSWQKS